MKIWVSLMSLMFLCVGGAPAAETQIVAGAGPSTELAQLFFSAFAARPEAAGTSFNVMPTSIKHAGGIKNSDVQLFGRTGRPLSAEEKAAGKREILLGRVAIGFATGLETGVKSLSLEQLRAIYERKISNWKQVGGSDAAIVLGGREANEAVYSELKDDFPWFRDVPFAQVFAKDDEVQKFIASPAGRHALVFGAVSQLPEKQLLKVDGFDGGIKVGLVYDIKNENHPLVKAASRFAASSDWRTLLKQNGQLALR